MKEDLRTLVTAIRRAAPLNVSSTEMLLVFISGHTLFCSYELKTYLVVSAFIPEILDNENLWTYSVLLLDVWGF